MNDRLLDQLQGLGWPHLDGGQSEPGAGQLWRCVWTGVAGLVVLVDHPSDRTVSVVAASSDDVGDELAFEATTTSGLRPIVWTGVTSSIKLCTLDSRVSDLTSDALARLRALRSGAARGTWSPIASTLDDRALVRADLLDGLETFAEAEWLPTQAAAPLADQLRYKGVTKPSELAQLLHVPPGEARELFYAHRSPTHEQEEALQGLLGTGFQSTLEVDPELVIDLEGPEFRHGILRLAELNYGGDEVAARRHLAERSMLVAARRREPGDRPWRAVISEVLRAD